MTNTELKQLLGKLGACKEAVNWVGTRDLASAWAECRRADWMLWLCGKMIGEGNWPTHEEIILATCDCAEAVLPQFEAYYPSDSRPRKAIEAGRAWAKGKASITQVLAAADAADDAAAAAYAARAANDAHHAAYADAAAAHAAVAYAAVYAIHHPAHAACAAYAAAHVAAAAADAYAAADAATSISSGLADLVRARLRVS